MRQHCRVTSLGTLWTSASSLLSPVIGDRCHFFLQGMMYFADVIDESTPQRMDNPKDSNRPSIEKLTEVRDFFVEAVSHMSSRTLIKPSKTTWV